MPRKQVPDFRETNKPDPQRINELIEELHYELGRYIGKSVILDHFAIRLMLSLNDWRGEQERRVKIERHRFNVQAGAEFDYEG